MDSPEPENRGKRGGFAYYFIRCSFTIVFSLVVSSLFSFLCGILAILIGNSSVPGPASVATQCKIVSSGVDIRSSKVCELGLLNYKAKHVFYPLESRRFRCHDDYYWASVFEVEYREDYSGQTLHAMAEAPKEALPQHCRPSFSAALLTKDKFKINGTYNCSYIPGLSKVEIFSDGLFNCKPDDVSTLEIIKRFFAIVLSTFANNLFTKRFSVQSLFRGAVAGVVSGVLVPTVVFILFRLLVNLKLSLVHKWSARRSLSFTAFATCIRRACVIVAYFSAMGWLAVQYCKMLGLSDLFISTSIREKLAKS